MSNITLYFKDGSSDKVYQCNIAPQDDGYVVNFAYGRRGGTLKGGTKTTAPVSLLEAEKIYNKLIQEKTSKGYTEGAAGTPYTATTATRKLTGYVPQLLNSIAEEEATALLRDDSFVAQEKKDGERMIAAHKDGVVTAGNKKGLSKSIAQPIEDDLKKLKSNIVLDSEVIGDKAYVFDILEVEDENLRSKPYSERLVELTKLAKAFKKLGITALEVVYTAITTKEKAALFNLLEKEEREGIVFKRKDAEYISGRPASNGSQLKYKFYATASVYVSCVNDKRSVAMQILDETTGAWLDVGNVTIPVNKEIPQEGAVIEVRYLYAYKGGSLFQTTYLGERNDVDKDECVISQLKYKAE
jgi:bifunctional non-homologous end joining protein LigD